MSDQNDYSVYIMWCNKKEYLYVGISNDPYRRYKQHMSSPTDLFFEVAKKYGKNSIGMLIVKSGLTKKDAQAYEAKYIYDALWKGVEIINQQVPCLWHYKRYLFLEDPNMSDEEFSLRCPKFSPRQKFAEIAYPKKRDKFLEII